MNVYRAILSEMLDIINSASVEFPASVGLALKTCHYRASRIYTYHTELAMFLIGDSSNNHPDFNSKAVRNGFEKVSKNFRQSVMLFRELVLGCGDLRNYSVFL